MIPSDDLISLILSAFTKGTNWLEASSRCCLDEFIEIYIHMRGRTQDTFESLEAYKE